MDTLSTVYIRTPAPQIKIEEFQTQNVILASSTWNQTRTKVGFEIKEQETRRKTGLNGPQSPWGKASESQLRIGRGEAIYADIKSMAFPADVSEARAVSAEAPIHDIPSMKVTQVGAAACVDLNRVCFQSVPSATWQGGTDTKPPRYYGTLSH